ncbi:MAG: UPF0175 family protein [Saprospiraceae bacterium]|nr:UPF0175 family protein [Saprospiraceae bacterium]
MGTSTPLVIPSDVVVSLGRDEAELRLELAVFFYAQLGLSSGEAAKFAGIPRVVFLRELGKRQIPVQYDVSDVEHDVRVMQEMEQKYPKKGE